MERAGWRIRIRIRIKKGWGREGQGGAELEGDVGQTN